MRRAAQIVDRLLVHAYCVIGLVIAYAYALNELDYYQAQAQAQAQALITMAARLTRA
jgi:hypothetical protein